MKPVEIRVTALQYRWTSHTLEGSLSFNWKRIVVTRTILVCTVANELMHLIHLDHSAFWNEPNKVMPGYRKSTNGLRDTGWNGPLSVRNGWNQLSRQR